MNARLGVAAILGAVTIYGLNFGFTRQATLRGLAPLDIVAMRFGIAGIIMLPVFIRRGVATCAGVGWGRGIVLAVAGGAPMTLIMNVGLSLAPAAHGAALGPGAVTAVGVVYGLVSGMAVPVGWTWAGLISIAAGLAGIAVAGTVSGSPNVLAGDLLFLTNGVIWGFYPVLLMRWRVDGITGAAVVLVLSACCLPAYFAFAPFRSTDVPLAYVAFQAVFQGLVNGIAGLWLWGYAVRVLGARSQLFPPLIPVLGTMFAFPILGEVPGSVQALGIAAIVGGIGMAVLGERIARRRSGA